MPCKRRFAAAIVALVVILAAQLTAYAAVTVVAEPGTDPAHVAMVQKTVDAFNAVVSQDLGVALDRDVRVFVCPTRENYRGVLISALGFSSDEAEKQSKLTGGFSSSQARAVVINMSVTGDAAIADRAYFATAHELFHQLQYQLAGDKTGGAYYWLKEGTADLIGAAVAEKVGHQSIDKWKLDQLNLLRQADIHASPHEILTTDLDRWSKLMETNQHPYQMADLMALHLMTQAKTGYRSIADYFGLLGKGVANEDAFVRAFGLPPAEAVVGFQTWFFGISSQPATVEVVAAPDVPAEILDDFNRGIDLTRQFLVATWGRDLQGMTRFVLVSGKPAYSAALVREFGLSPAKAEQRAKETSWWAVGSTTVLDITAFAAKRDRLFHVASSLARRATDEAAPIADLSRIFWMPVGASSVAAAHVVELSGAYTVEQYRRSSLAALAKARSYPSLADLATLKGWQDASAKHGKTPVSLTILLASLYIADKHGPAAFAVWFKAVKETGRAETAFEKTFGIPIAQFSDEFSAYLNSVR